MAAAVKESFRSVHAQAGAAVDARLRGVLQEGDGRRRLVERAATAASAPAPRARQSPAADVRRRVNFVMPAQPVAARAFAGDAAQMPFMLHLYPSAAFADGRTAHLPWLQEMPDPMTTVMWGSWVEINPETAHKLEIHEGDVLTITSPQGSDRAAGVSVSRPASRRDCDSRRTGTHAVRALRAERRREPAAASAHRRSTPASGAVVQTRRPSERGEDRPERTADSIRRIGCARAS